MNRCGLILLVAASAAIVVNVLSAPLGGSTRSPAAQPTDVERKIEAVRDSIDKLREGLTPMPETRGPIGKGKILAVIQRPLTGCKRNVLADLNNIITSCERNGHRAVPALRELRANYYRLCEAAFIQELEDAWHSFAVNAPNNRPRLSTIGAYQPVFGRIIPEIWNDGEALESLISEVIALRPDMDPYNHAAMTHAKSFVQGIVTNAREQRRLYIDENFDLWQEHFYRELVRLGDRFEDRLAPLLGVYADFDKGLRNQLDPVILRLIAYERLILNVIDLFSWFALIVFDAARKSDALTDDHKVTALVASRLSSSKDDSGVPKDTYVDCIICAPPQGPK